MPSYSRRRLLATAASGTLATTAGCFWESSSQTSILELYLVNNDSEPVTIEFRVFADGDLVYEDRREIEAGMRRPLPCEWPTSASSYRIECRRESGERFAKSYDTGDDHCLDIEPRDGTIGISEWGSCPTKLNLGAEPCE